jgi:hypothetical protein
MVVVATGPSLTVDDINACRGRMPVVVVNDAYRLAPWADVLYACDRKWWGWQGAYHDSAIKSFRGHMFSLEPTRIVNVTSLKNTGREGLELDPSGLRTGRNSGYQAINLSVHLGARRIVLLGFDMSPGAGGKSHYFGEHPDDRKPPLTMFRKHFRTIAQPLKDVGVEVINCSRRSALTAFPKLCLKSMLAQGD